MNEFECTVLPCSKYGCFAWMVSIRPWRALCYNHSILTASFRCLFLFLFLFCFFFFCLFLRLIGYIMLCPFFVCSKCQCLRFKKKKKKLTTLNHLPLCFLDKIWWQDRHRASFAWVLTLMFVQPLDLQGTLHASLIHSFIYPSSFSVKIISGLRLSEILKILQKLPDIWRL